MRNLLVVALTLLVSIFSVNSASAFVWATSAAELHAFGGLDIQVPGNDHDYFNSVTDPNGRSVAFDRSMEVVTANLSWTGWGNGYDGNILFTDFNNSLRITFDHEIWGWGMNLQPNADDDVEFLIQMSDGHKTMMSVDGLQGMEAEFFGFYGGAVEWIDLEIIGYPNTDGFAIGQMVTANDPVPEPGTLVLMGLGLIAAGAMRKRFSGASRRL